MCDSSSDDSSSDDRVRVRVRVISLKKVGREIRKKA
jgi:hypothetical protein